MKYVEMKELKRLSGNRLNEHDPFAFDCYPGIACFNQCCRNLNLFLYPYDVIRLKARLKMSSDRFIDHYVAVVLREANHFPDVLLRMSDEAGSACPFVTPSGCSVYFDRPDTCRKFPMEQAVQRQSDSGKIQRLYFFKPPEFCRGPRENRTWTPAEWARDPDDMLYDTLTLEWAKLKALLQNDPWGREGPDGAKAKMTFMAMYNIDAFREFIFKSSFLHRYKIQAVLLKKIEKDDVELIRLAFDWVRFYLWGIKSEKFRPG